MAASRNENTGNGSINFLTIAEGNFWQKKGYSEDSEFYEEEKYESQDKDDNGNPIWKTRKGLKFDNVSGKLNGIFFKENEWGEFMNVNLVDTSDDSKWSISFKLSGAWTGFSLAKRMFIALMSLNKDEVFSVHVSGNKDEKTGFTNVVLWVKQGGKNLVLNPTADESKFDESKQVAMPDDVLIDMLSIDTPTKEESKAMSKKQKLRAREDEMDAIKALFQSKYLPDLGHKEEKDEEVADKKDEPIASEVKKEKEAEAPEEEVADNTQEETPRERRLRELRERKAKK